MIDFRKMLKKEMKKRKLSVPALARAVELHHQTIYDYLEGKSQITAANLEKILNFFDNH